MPCKRIVIFWLIFGLVSSVLIGQDIETSLIPDRPGRSPFPSRLDKSVLILETGYTRSIKDIEEEKELSSIVPLSLRYGLLTNMEVHVDFTWQSVSREYNNIDSLRTSGLAASTVGGKFRIAEEKGIFPLIEFHGLLELPWFGNEKFIPEDVVPSFDFNFLHHLNASTNLSYGFGMFWNPGGENGNYGIKLTKFLNNSNAFFVEHYSYLRGNFKVETHLAGGYVLLINDKVQFDAGLDIGKAKDTIFFSFDLGCSVLLKPGH